MENYTDFVVHKSERAVHTDSIALTVDDLNNKLYDFQKDIVRWALAKGRAAIFADCGLGKTAMQLEWAHRVCVCAYGWKRPHCSAANRFPADRGRGHEIRSARRPLRNRR